MAHAPLAFRSNVHAAWPGREQKNDAGPAPLGDSSCEAAAWARACDWAPPALLVSLPAAALATSLLLPPARAVGSRHLRSAKSQPCCSPQRQATPGLAAASAPAWGAYHPLSPRNASVSGDTNREVNSSTGAISWAEGRQGGVWAGRQKRGREEERVPCL